MRNGIICRYLRDVPVMDRVHEHITLPPIVARAVDTAAFQRLRSLKQLGSSSYLYPAAVHTRFEHSIGVAHIAQLLLGRVQRCQPDLRINDKDREKVMLAGLLHDVGHGPFSHLFEEVMSRKFGLLFDHDKMSQTIGRNILKVLLPKDDVEDVLRVMRGEPASHLVYTEIVTNKRNGIDVDKLDYFLRDSLCCFGKPTVDVRLSRLFNSARLVQYEGQWQLAFEEKVALSLRELFVLRTKLHKNVYQHRVVKAIDHMICDIMGAAAPYFLVHGHTLLECVCHEELFLKLGDWVLDAIESSADTNLKPAQDIISRLRSRDIYRFILSRALKSEAAPPDNWLNDVAEDIVAAVSKKQSTKITKEDIIVDQVVINHGKGNSDPLQSVLFFNPKRPSQSYFKMSSSASRHSTLFTPFAFEERTLMIFECRDTGGAVLKAADAVVSHEKYSKYFVDSLPFYNTP
ncbi:hypothetical protein, conserved [Trypanosoma brucei gambiense DAL972]|uniref:HD domain-containing protein n=2 Tax=Trypanosoma brucei TaxID=5691 RepID=C9ZTA3_TRYB9|nr:hypothetical protein, conserved [Trypanosoma brucei gambiense DAL972]RHW71331.1 HD domain containing protein [Trypanosoma brucei equiperdum]CBH12638.1 hypothetical protein, conserved [Trypanosoma brucei gambiense DAL972]|eukprot:XP_011774918.1 hypothetical protein, conserved [Trypanosoma brucei gambiense DAL972]